MGPLIAGRDIVRSYGHRRALDRVDITVAAGELLALAGPNGAGKTTLLRMLATLQRPDAGTLTVFGEPVPDRADRVRGRIGYLGHDPGVYLDLTPLQNLEFFADLYGIPDRDARIEELLELVGLIHRAHDATRTFSRGMVQRLGVARLLVHDPALLFLDEPHSGLDALGEELLNRILTADRTAVIVTHDLENAAEWADRIMVLDRGRCAGEIRPDGRAGRVVRDEYRAMVA